MTLHWWMHWFWVTMLLSLIASSRRVLGAPQAFELQPTSTATEAAETVQPHVERQPRAMYFTKAAPLPLPHTPPTTSNTNTTDTTPTTPTASTNTTEHTQTNSTFNTTTQVSPIKWTKINATVTTNVSNGQQDTTKNATLLTLIDPLTDPQNATFSSRKRNLTPDSVRDDANLEGISESRIVTEKPLSLETTLLQTKMPPIIESSRQVIEPGNRMDTGAIAGISFAALALTALAGSTGFVLYRRRYLNKPQTLNDKCSNPDSSGYLDDSTIRDNSEEMYSLDNDSFLNSLEAMTIQNYWTDTVKHTKL
ncbi:PREDICTED: integumentary mucin C.1 [Papilio xuthus]|uniref:Integumentary mucin C.1 n=1 Tax=Papilio xuthus TaxID=66420 RepID=A0AAJ6ZQT1_PAPXU|nr:PREDICTED: integumentary mucin C.1 [Papilio xuthus]XP_013177443.1 PREDICTED: integumentary mucin C.1 [Papilio xuthus]XP_013177444.1 PREDICTED: integumentary mucin C.1 [Papilio xuthus]XP_013177446.1 PREDICTED: integumentary mucin C.1 [Papilio xuthus]